MAIIDFDFYKNEYGGCAVAEDSFKQAYRKAERALNRLTFSRICEVDGTYGQQVVLATHEEFMVFTDKELVSVKLGLCALVDAIGKLDAAEQQALAGSADASNVKSRSSGGESISYESRKTAYDEALTDKSKKNELFRSALLQYIQPDAFRLNPFYAGSW